MLTRFPEPAWINALMEKLNNDEVYNQMASGWEGDFLFEIQADALLPVSVVYYLDLWHGKCREAYKLESTAKRKTSFALRGPYLNFVRILTGEWHVMQALLTRKLKLEGNMAYLMRQVPTVLEFVRCCQEVTTSYVGSDESGDHAAHPGR
jgi:putative sterol carrier protein